MAKPKKPSRKELLKSPDEFLTLSARAAIFVREHSKQFQYIGAAVLAAILVYLGINTYLDYIHKKGQNAYNVAYYNLVKDMNLKGDEKDLKKSEALFKKVMDKYGLSKVSRLAPPQMAYLKYREKKYDEAISLYQKFLNEIPHNTPYQALARLALAACYEEKGELEKAIETLNAVMSGAEDLFKEQAMLSLARIYRLLNQNEKAKAVLEEFVDKYKTSPFFPMAKARLGDIES
ncbi:MAG: tetratricopeptide repeat protein [Desulfobacteraceae bacterium]|jgi:predicted negative regulator of RcsB-dependent stress response